MYPYCMTGLPHYLLLMIFRPQPSAYAQPAAAYVPAGQPYAAPARQPTQYPTYDTGHPTAAYAYTPAPPAPAGRPVIA